MKKIYGIFASLSLAVIGLNYYASAAPYGAGRYNEDVPYGSATSLTISTDGNTSIHLSPTENGALGTGSSQVSVTSTDIIGYKLYVRSEAGSRMHNGPDYLESSDNIIPDSLTINTWGYNTDGSSSFVGMPAADTLVRARSGPFSSGDTTTFTYGVFIDNAKPAGNYTTSVVYTAVPQTY